LVSQSTPSGKDFYSHSGWDESTWVDVIAIEYERLMQAFPFDKTLHSLSAKAPVKLLDIGCGTGIFPRFLDPSLSADTRLECDLLDISAESLRAAEKVFGDLAHFEVDELFNMSIEEMPQLLSPENKRYEVIWAIHSFTTVDQSQMKTVFEHIRRLLATGGYFFIYQLAAESSYQALHQHYAEASGLSAPTNPYMQFEDSLQLLDEIAWPTEVHEQTFPHRVPKADLDTLEAYLQKVVLDDSINAIELFGDFLDNYSEADEYVFPQKVNLIVLRN
jgi:ubiquinone/menaquinone biosynthesis C-methylase UbiE